MGKVTTMSERLGPQPGERIDREQPVNFTFEGRRYRGYRGDTLSTALWASGVRVLGRSFKYHRPRGIFSLSGLDCNALAENRDSTNLRMDTTLIEPGLEARAVNTWGGVRSDLYRFTELFSPFLPVGFYYKVFHRPRSLFPFFERRMRRIAGLGNIHPDQPLQPTPKRYDFCDLLVVGSGPAGLSAAVAAAELGLKVLLVEEDRLPGGTLGFQLPGEPEAGGLLERAPGQGRRPAQPGNAHRNHGGRLLRRRVGGADRLPETHQAAGPRPGGGGRVLRPARRLSQQRPPRGHAGLGGTAPDPPVCGEALPPGCGAGGQHRRIPGGGRPAPGGGEGGAGLRPAAARGGVSLERGGGPATESPYAQALPSSKPFRRPASEPSAGPCSALWTRSEIRCPRGPSPLPATASP